jgi:hypothetical protein
MISKTKLVIVPVFVALAVSMSACGDSHSTDNTSKTGSITQVETESSVDDNTGGMGMTYNGKMGIDMGGGLIMPMNGGTPQLGFGF